MLKKLLRKVKERPGLIVLLGILLIIDIISFNPHLFLVGWDDFSSYFNIHTNIFRTFFATWRDYRSLGVASDSEAVDIFRQLFFFILQPFFPLNFLDQIYILLSLNVGVLSMYAFAAYFVKKTFNVTHEGIRIEVIAFFSAFFYLFNLNTVSTFYFPMIMYVNRFFTLPLLLLIFAHLLLEKKISLKKYILIIATIFFASGSYLTATIFITVSLLLLIFGIFQHNIKRFIIVFLFFLAMNAFWLLPFANYAKQKSPIIPLAPAYIDVNEGQLNKPKDFYSLYKQLILYPNFFDTKVSNIDVTQKKSFHPWANNLQKFPYNVIIFTFPILYALGMVIIIKTKKKSLSWIPISILLFLFLVMKDFSPLGFLYAGLSKTIPYFDQLFRFGDTKFHPIIAFSGSIAAAFSIQWIAETIWKKFHKSVVYAILFILILVNIFVFYRYFTGGLIGSFMYSDIPSAYFSMAKIINGDTDNVRVLQLPFDNTQYWKSYVWGMFGSSFFHFMINKPLIDKTFDPGSMENSYLIQQINSVINNYQSISNAGDQEARARELYSILTKASVKYVIVDESVNAQIYPRGITMWGTFNTADSKKIAGKLENLGLAHEVGAYSINLNDYLNEYEKLFPLDSKTFASISGKQYTIHLLELSQPYPRIEFLEDANILDNNLQNPYPLNLNTDNKRYIQSPDLSQPARIYPFLRDDAQISINQNTETFTLKNTLPAATTYTLGFDPTSEMKQHMVSAYISKQNNSSVISLYDMVSPSINQLQFRKKIKDVVIPTGDNIQAIQIDDTVMKLPNSPSGQPALIGTTLIQGNNMQIQLLRLVSQKQINPSGFVQTNDPNCFQDKLTGYTESVIVDKNQLHVSSTNGSTCFWIDLQKYLTDHTQYMELTMDTQGISKDLDKNYGSDTFDTSKSILRNIITQLPKPNYASICLKEYNIDDCLNTHQTVNIDGDRDITIASDIPLAGRTDISVVMGLKNTNYQYQDFMAKNIALYSYEAADSTIVTLSPINNASISQQITISNGMTLSFPLPTSTDSYYFHSDKDGFFLSNDVCSAPQSYRTYRMLNNQLLSYFENCDNEVMQTLPFSSNNFYQWIVGYNLMSGKYPQFILKDGFNEYANNWLSLNQGYPDVKGFKAFENPEWFTDKKTVETTLDKLPIQTAYINILAQPDIADSLKKNFVIHQDSENEGGVLYDSFNVVPLPDYWQGMYLEPVQGSERSFITPASYQTAQILPSLWKVDVNRGTNQNGDELLLFNTGYDTQWNAYGSVTDLLLGKPIDAEHVKCDGYFNCYTISSKQQQVFLFYDPEKLSFLGWGLTLLAFLFFAKIFVFRKPETGK